MLEVLQMHALHPSYMPPELLQIIFFLLLVALGLSSQMLTIMDICHCFKNRTGHRTVFLKISGSTPVFDRFLAGFPVVDRLLTGFEAFNRTGLAPRSRLNRSDRPVQSGFLKQWTKP